MDTWEEIRVWRRAMRAELLSKRLRVPREERECVRAVVRDIVQRQFPDLHRACIGFYWPIKGEIDLRHLVRSFITDGAEAALPIVVKRLQPLEFRAWYPRMKLERGVWNIPVPATSNAVQPTALLVPLLGFDAMGYRLGYGGGYFDRTLATKNPRPLTIGVGYANGRLNSIHPQQHDVPLDAIVTEAGCERFRHRNEPIDHRASAASPDRKLDLARKKTFLASDAFNLSNERHGPYDSPPCFMHELDRNLSE